MAMVAKQMTFTSQKSGGGQQLAVWASPGQQGDKGGSQYPLAKLEHAPSIASETLEEKKARIKIQNIALCKNITFYVVFLACFTVSVLLDQSPTNAHIVDVVTEKLTLGAVPLSSVGAVPDVYSYLYEVLIPNLYENNTDTNLATAESESLLAIDMYNRLLGPIRLRQVRVAPQSDCQMQPLFSNFQISCLPSLLVGVEDASSFGPAGMFAWGEDGGGTSYTGGFATYSPNGYMVYLPSDGASARTRIAALQSKGYMDKATRALFIEFNIFSSNVGVYAAVQLVFEFGASGGAIQTVNALTMSQKDIQVGGLGATTDWLAFIFLIVVMLLVIYFMVEEFQVFVQDWKGYFFDFWNVLDWVNMILLIIGFIMRLLNFSNLQSPTLGAAQLRDKESWVSFTALATSISLAKFLDGFNAVLIWAKSIKYTQSMPVIKDLIRVVWSAFSLFFAIPVYV